MEYGKELDDTHVEIQPVKIEFINGACQDCPTGRYVCTDCSLGDTKHE